MILMTEMQRLTVYISGKPQESGYRDRSVSIAKIFMLKGYAKNQNDGHVKVVAEGEAVDLQHFFFALELMKERDALDIQREYSSATGEFEFFLDTDKPDRYFQMRII